MNQVADLVWAGPHDKITLSPRHGGRVTAWQHGGGDANLVSPPVGLEGGLLRTLLAEERYPGHSYCTAHLVAEQHDDPAQPWVRLRYFWYTPNVFARLFGWTDKLCPRYLDGLLLEKTVRFHPDQSALSVQLVLANLSGGPRRVTPWVQSTFGGTFQHGFVYWDGQRRDYQPSGDWWAFHRADGAATMRVVHQDLDGKLFAVTGAAPQPLAGMLKYDPADFGPGGCTAMQELRYRPVSLEPGQLWEATYFVALTDEPQRWAADAPAPLAVGLAKTAVAWDETSLLPTLAAWALPEEHQRGLMVISYLDKLPFTSGDRYRAADLLAGFHPAGRGRAESSFVICALRNLDSLRIHLSGDRRWRLTQPDGTPLPPRTCLRQHQLLRVVVDAPASLLGKNKVRVRVSAGAGRLAELQVAADARVGPRHAYQFQQMAPYLEQRLREDKLEFRGATRREFWAWQRGLRQRYQRWMRDSVRGHCPLAPRLLERQVGPTCVRDKIAIQTEPGMWLPSFVVYPRRPPRRRMPAVIVFHGSGPGKEAYAPDEQAGPFWAHGDCDLMGMPYGLAREMGCLVYIPDQRSQGEWGEWFSQAAARRAGYDTLAMRMWDHTRSIDYLCSRPDVDPQRIGCCGSSGGGMATMYTAGIDERIATGILSSMPPYLVKLPDQFFNDMWSDGDLGDAWAPLATTPSITPNVCALTIPRPLWIMDGEQDSGLWEGDKRGELTKALTKWQAARDEIARLYELAGVPERFRQSWFPGGHCSGMTVANAVEWFGRWL